MIRTWLRKSPVLTSIIALIITYGFYIAPFWDDSDLFQLMIRELIVGSVMLILIALITGVKEIKFSLKGFGFAFKRTWIFLLLSVLLSSFSLVLLFTGRSTFTDHILLKFIELIILALFIGFYEEGLFRGLFLNAFLSKWGHSHKGIFNAALLSSILFGALHIYPSIIHGEITDLISFGTALGKTLQAGMLAFVLAAVYLKTRNFWDIAIIHGLNDFIVFISTELTVIPNSESSHGNYTSGGSMGLIMIGFYIVMILITLFPTIKAAKILKELPLPQEGFFEEAWSPINPYENEIVNTNIS